jgi:hypothetical protein
VPVESVWDRAFIEVLQDVLKGGMEHLNRPVRDLYLAGEKQ